MFKQDLIEKRIGTVDSGMGGDNYTRLLRNIISQESLNVMLNVIRPLDTVNLIWGDLPPMTVQLIVQSMVNMCAQLGCDLIAIACNTAVAAMEKLGLEVPDQMTVLNVVEETVRTLREEYQGKSILMLATPLTVNSGIYRNKLADHKLEIRLDERAVSTWAPMIEKHLIYEHELTLKMLQADLEGCVFADYDAVLLACTHFSLVKRQIEQIIPSQVEIIDTAEILARATTRLIKG